VTLASESLDELLDRGPSFSLPTPFNFCNFFDAEGCSKSNPKLFTNREYSTRTFKRVSRLLDMVLCVKMFGSTTVSVNSFDPSKFSGRVFFLLLPAISDRISVCFCPR
jgi:hypothetical protein